MAVPPRDILQRAKSLFTDRKPYEAYWDTAYRFMLPERAVFFNRDQNRQDPDSIADEVFDSTAEDSAERLANLILARLTPPWQTWFRLVPGDDVLDEAQREQMRAPLQLAARRMHRALAKGNFYQEFQPMLLDRIIGGTGALARDPGDADTPVRFRCTPLSDTALAEDGHGRVVAIAQCQRYNLRELVRAYPDGVPALVREQHQGTADKRELTVYHLEVREVDGTYAGATVLEKGPELLDKYTSATPRRFATRWTKIPGSAYGRGPGLRALSDVRALNKLKEMSLKQAMLAVAGPYTVLDDGVINPMTIAIEPGELIPVASNDLNNPSIRPLEQGADFNVSMFNIEELRNSVKSVFMMDQFGDLNRTPLSATEVMERTRIIAQDLGASIARLQHEVLVPVLQATFQALVEAGQLPEELSLDDSALKVEFTSYLAQSQWRSDEEAMLEWAQYGASFGELDPEAGMVPDLTQMMRDLAELKGIPAKQIRNQDQVQQMVSRGVEGAAALQGAAGEGGGSGVE